MVDVSITKQKRENTVLMASFAMHDCSGDTTVVVIFLPVLWLNGEC